jgi:hypothetical protein
MQTNPIETPFRARILIGSSETLSGWIAVCPECNRSFRLQWPNSILHIPLHRVVDLNCPVCEEAYSVVAAALVADEEGEELPIAVVHSVG